MKRKTANWLSAAAAAAGFAGCLFVNVTAALILFGTAAAVFMIQLLAHHSQQKEITQICDYIGEILRGAETVQFSSFEEGEMSILASEIRKMTIRLREQNAQLREEKQFMKESLEDISHQLRTPLTSMMLILGMLRKPDLPKQTRMEQVQELFSLLARMQWLIETLLSFSRIEAGAVQFREETVDCAAMIRAALEPISIALELKDIAVNVQIEGNPHYIGDLSYSVEAVGNVLKNCMEHTPEGGTITVAAQENPIYAGILITDSGAGIAQEDLPHIFERFYQSSDFAKKGFGIGLAFARKIVTAQHGSLQVRNAQPHGAQFDLRFYKTVV